MIDSRLRNGAGIDGPQNATSLDPRFGTFEVELRAGELRKRGVKVKLQEQPFQVLAALLQRPSEVVTREELRKQIWSEDTFVDFDNSLSTAINKPREALGDSTDNPRSIETLPRRGYRFIAPISSEHRGKSPITAMTWKIALPAIVVALVAAIVAPGLLWRLRQSRWLTERDTIVLADFKNSTGDPVFDDTLKQGLRVQLEQSPFLNILSDQKVSEELHLMGRSSDERLIPELARDLCQRVGSKVVLTGSISSVGSHYVTKGTSPEQFPDRPALQNCDQVPSEEMLVDRLSLLRRGTTVRT